MVQIRLIIPCTIIYLHLLLCTTTNALRYKINNLECTGNTKFVINLKCRLRAINRDKSVFNISCDTVDVLDNVSVHFQIWQKNSKNIYRPFLINGTENICDVLDKKGKSIYATIALNVMKEFSNVNHTCPYRGHIFAKNGYMDQRFIPVLPPPGLYKVVYRLFHSYSLEEVGSIIFYVEVTD